MLKLKNRKGFTLIEVLCSLGILSIVFISVISCELTAINMKKNLNTISNDVLIMETLKNNIIYSMKYSELVTIESNKSFYIHKENLSLEKLKGEVISLFSVTKPVKKPYIELSFLQCEFKVYHLKIILNPEQTINESQLQYDFYKGYHR
jgi:prepilin-type N-terminal cleavage/methylation domain-containing protein